MAEIARQYTASVSEPSFFLGACPPCASTLLLNVLAHYEDDSLVKCVRCGRGTARHLLIQEALATVDSIAWSFAGSDFVVWDRFQMTKADHALYTISEKVAKWLREGTIPRPGSGVRYIPEVGVYNESVLVTLRDTAEYNLPPEDPPPAVEVNWYRFGLSDLTAVPAWRQSLFAAAMMVDGNPSAAMVLIAAGFEAFFTETMRIKWYELGLRPGAFKSVVSSQRIAALVDWLPGAVGLASLPEAPGDLHERWRSLVNGRRNAVVHRANVHFSSEQAVESLRCALECISYIDSLALFRPHPYYAGE